MRVCLDSLTAIEPSQVGAASQTQALDGIGELLQKSPQALIQRACFQP